MARRWLTIAVCLAFTAPAAAEGSRQQGREIRALKHQVSTLKATVTRWREFATGLEAQVKTLTSERDSARFGLMSAQIDNNNLRAGLPDAIKAVPLDRFWELVFTPVRAAWRCNSLYSSTSSGYWSLDFVSDC